jgi:hypothetical protein
MDRPNAKVCSPCFVFGMTRLTDGDGALPASLHGLTVSQLAALFDETWLPFVLMYSDLVQRNAQVEALKKEVRHWKSAHADEVRKKRAGQKATKERIAELRREAEGLWKKAHAGGEIIEGQAAEIRGLREQLEVTGKILESRTEVLEAIPGCPLHGNQCVPHALVWVQAQMEQEHSTD